MFLSIFSAIQFLIYSFISYKTPWLILNFWVGFIFLAGYGIYKCFLLLKKLNHKIIFILIVIMFLGFNSYQTFITSFKYSYQVENPFTYSQPTPDIILAADVIKKITETNHDSSSIFIDIIAKDDDYWPLPWYLRDVKNIAWNNHVNSNIYKFQIIISTPDFEEDIIEKLYSLPPAGEKNLYIPLFNKYTELRPGVEIRGYVQKDLFDQYQRNKDKTVGNN